MIVGSILAYKYYVAPKMAARLTVPDPDALATAQGTKPLRAAIAFRQPHRAAPTLNSDDGLPLWDDNF